MKNNAYIMIFELLLAEISQTFIKRGDLEICLQFCMCSKIQISISKNLRGT